MAIDHANRDGNIERRKLYGSNTGTSYAWYLKLRRESVRNDLRVLCHNCNMAIAFYGYCPHQGRPDLIQQLILTDNEVKIMLYLNNGYNHISDVANNKSLIASLGSLIKKDLIFRNSKGIYELTEDGSSALNCCKNKF